MRRTAMTICLTITLLTAGHAQAADKVTAPINHLTIYTNGAQVERSASVQLSAGEQTVTFTAMSPFMDTKSMQVKATGRLTVMGVSHRTTHPDSATQVARMKKANEQVKAVERRIQLAKDEQDMLTTQLELVKANCSVTGRTVATPLQNIKELNTYYAQEVLRVKKRSQELDEQLTALNMELDSVKDKRDSLAKVKLATATEIDVKVNAQQTGKATFTLVYYVKNAGWFPSYDVRSNSTKEPLQLSYKANIWQNTREEWKSVPVTLSSANPNRSNVAPQLQTYWLDYGLSAPRYDAFTEQNTVSGHVVSAADGDPIIGATVCVNGTRLATVTDINGAYSIVLPQGKRQLTFSYIGYETQIRTATSNTLNIRMKEDAAALEEVAVVGYGRSKKKSAYRKEAPQADMMMVTERMPKEEAMEVEEESAVMEVDQQQALFGYEFNIKPLLTLPANGKAVTTEVARHQLAAQYEYQGIPKVDKEAFLVADATGWDKLNLLEGEANVYFDNAFVGKSILDSSTPSDTLHFSMGRDQGIRLQRTKVSDKSSRRFLGSNQEQDMTWRIVVKNTRQEPVTLTVYDQTPVSRNSQISVTIEDLSGGLRDEQTGIVSWPMQLQPGEQRELLLQYKVKYPKNRRLTVE